MSTLRPSTVIVATIGVGVLGFLGYAVYFDHRRRTDAEFRTSLKRDARRAARIARTQAEAEADADSKAQRAAIKEAVDSANAEGFPSSQQEMEAYVMDQLSQGEILGQQPGSEIEAALCFYKVLKVYPSPADLVNILDQTVRKPVLDILAEMIALDSSINIRSFGRTSASSGSSTGSNHGVDD